MSSTITVALQCPTKKKTHETREAAEAFAATIRERHPEQVRQYAYACEDCPGWHLTALPPESHGLVKSHLAQGPTQLEIGRGKYDGQEGEIVKLFKQGLTIKQISEKTGVPYMSVRYRLASRGMLKTRGGSRPSVIQAPTSIEELSGQEAALQAQLQTVQERKQKLIEAKALRIEVLESEIVIKKEGNVLRLAFKDAEELVERLIECLPREEAK